MNIDQATGKHIHEHTFSNGYPYSRSLSQTTKFYVTVENQPNGCPELLLTIDWRQGMSCSSLVVCLRGNRKASYGNFQDGLIDECQLADTTNAIEFSTRDKVLHIDSSTKRFKAWQTPKEKHKYAREDIRMGRIENNAFFYPNQELKIGLTSEDSNCPKSHGTNVWYYNDLANLRINDADKNKEWISFEILVIRPHSCYLGLTVGDKNTVTCNENSKYISTINNPTMNNPVIRSIEFSPKLGLSAETDISQNIDHLFVATKSLLRLVATRTLTNAQLAAHEVFPRMATDYKLTLAPIAVGTEKQEIHQNQIICSMKEKWLIYRDNIFFLKHPITGITQKSFLLEIPEPPKKAEADKENNGNKVHLQLRNQRAIGNEVCFESICTMLGVLPCEMRNQRTCEMRCRETQETECKSFKNWLGVLGRESVLFSGPLRKLTIAEDGTQCKARHKCVDGSCVIKQDWELFIEGAVVFINDPSNWYPGNWKENIDKQQ